MIINKLDLHNFRSVKGKNNPLTFEFCEKINLLVGTNGSGKTTVLEAVAKVLFCFVERFKNRTSNQQKLLSEHDINNDCADAKIKVTCQDASISNELSWTLAKNRTGYEQRVQDDLIGLDQALGVFRKAYEEKGCVPLLAYYPVNRVMVDIPERIRTRHEFNPIAAYDDFLSPDTNFRTFFEWFLVRQNMEDDLAYEALKRGETLTRQPLDPMLQTVRHALQSFLPEFSDFRIKQQPQRMEVKKNKELFSIQQFSDGEKNLISLVADLARRFVLAYSQMPNPLEGEGIVLIDELELHLHPRWQGMMIEQLAKTFPNCQFIISTHSPQVVNHLEKGKLFLLSNSAKGLEATPVEQQFFGYKAEAILAKIMGTEHSRPLSMEEKLKRLFDFLDDSRLQEAQSLCDELSEQIPQDPTFLRAQMVLRRKQRI